MNPFAAIFVFAGVALALVAGLGLLRFTTPYARLHSAGKASPISFLLIAIGCSLELGVVAALELAVAGGALIVTIPAVTHLLFRAVHGQTGPQGSRVEAHPSSSAPPSTTREEHSASPSQIERKENL